MRSDYARNLRTFVQELHENPLISVAEAARRAGVCERSGHRYLRALDAGVDYTAETPQERNLREVGTLLASGLTQKEVALKTGLSRRYVLQLSQKLSRE